MRDINLIVVHMSYTRPSQDIGVEVIDEWHKERGWDGVGYHYVIRRDGTIEEGRKNEVQGAHAKGHNEDSLGICLIGGRKEDEDEPECNYTRQQWRELESLVSRLANVYNAEVLGHNDLSNKACPGFNVTEWWNSKE